MRELEARIAYDASLAPSIVDPVGDVIANDDPAFTSPAGLNTDAPHAAEADDIGVEETAVSGAPGAFVFVDANLPDYDLLLAGIDPSVEVVMLDSTRDGVEQMAEFLALQSQVDAIHIISHGDAGNLSLGTGQLNAGNIDGIYRDELSVIANSLSQGADILIYGCDFGAGAEGEDAVAKLRLATGADIAASDDDTGHESLGGDWELEVRAGLLETEVAVSSSLLDSWLHLLPNSTVADNFDDGAGGSSGYQGNDGTQNWVGDWTEVGDTNNRINVVDRSGGGDWRLLLQGDGSVKDYYVYRAADLSGSTFATLTYDYEQDNSWDAEFAVEIRDGDTGWTQVAYYNPAGGNATGSETINIAANLRDNGNTELRFRSSIWTDPEFLYIDNVQIEHDGASSNNDPTITSNGGGTSANINAAENQTTVTTVTATDPDIGDTLTYTIDGGADAALFSMNSTSGVLTFNSAPDFESPGDANSDGVYEVTVGVNDGNGGADSQALQVTVTNVAESISGTAIYRDLNNTDASAWDGSSFAAAVNVTPSGDYRILQGEEAPTRDEIIILGVDESGNIGGEIWDGTSWSALPAAISGTVSQTYWWSVDVAYDQVSGDAMLVWADGANIEYAIWDGTSWSSTQNLSAYSGATPRQLQLAPSPDSNEMVLVVSDSNGDDSAYVWDGSAWINRVSLDTTGGSITSVYVAYEQQSGDAMVAYGKSGAPDVYYRIWDGSAWGGENNLSAASGVSNRAEWVTLAADPNSDQIVMGVGSSGGTGADLWAAVWDGTSWSSPALLETSANGSIFPNIAVAFESQSGDALAAYGQNGQGEVRYRTWTSGGGWSGELIGPNISSAPNTLMLYSDPLSDSIMLAAQEASEDVNYVHWDGSAWGVKHELTTNTTENKNQPFLFVWNVSANNDPTITSNGGGATANVNAAENQTTVTTVTATDPDVGDTLTYSVAGGADAALFSINSSSGALSFNAPPDFESPTDVGADGTYEVTVQVDDGNGGTDTQAISVTVTDVAESGTGITAPATSGAVEDVAYVYSGANTIQVNDGLAGDNRMQVTLSVSNGSLNLASIAGINFIEGANGSASMVIEGLESSLNTALNGMTYTPAAGYSGADTLNIVAATEADLVGHYTFEAGDARDDSAGLPADDGTMIASATTITDGTRGEVLELNGTTDYVQITGEFGQPPNVTLAAWVKADAAYTEVFSIENRLILRIDDISMGGGVNAIYHDGTAYQRTEAAQSIAGTGWHHVALTFDDAAKTMTLYIDGVVAAQNTFANSISYIGGNSYIGANNGASLFFDGNIDDARVYDRALSSGEIAILAADLGRSTQSVSITVDADTDGDSVGDSVDIDDDNDGILDTNESFAVDLSGPAPVADGVEDSSYPKGYWAVSYYEGHNGIPSSPYSASVDGNGTAGSPTYAGEAYFGYASNATYINIGGGDSTVLTSENFTTDVTGFVDSSTPSTGTPTYWEAVHRRTVTDDGFLDFGAVGDTTVDDALRVSINGTVVFNHYPGSADPRPGPPPTYANVNLAVSAGDEVEIVVINLGGQGGYGFTFNTPADLSGNDADGDGILDHLDIDSDNDGITDNVEAQTTAGYIAPSGSDSDGDGLDNAYDATPGAGTAGSLGLTPVDSDTDTIADFLDPDSDGDGTNDVVEAGHGITQSAINASADSDGDGLKDVVDAFAAYDPNDDDLDPTNTNFNLADTDADTLADGSNAAPPNVDLDYRDTNVPPAITGGATANVNAAENQTSVTTVTATDGDIPADTLTFSIIGGADAALFAITAGGILTFNTAPNFESPSDADTNGVYEVTVQVSDGNGGTDSQAISVTVTNVNEAPTGTPAITGTAAEDQTLTADTSGIGDPDGLGAFSYQWYRDTGGGPAAIGGATASTYTLGDADVGATITVSVSYVDGGGTAEGPLVSSPTAAVTNVNDAPTGTPAITGTVAEDQTLTADTSGIGDADGLGAFSYQWYRDTGGGPVAVGGATASTYTLGDADVGATMTVAVTYVDGNGTAEGPLVSAPTAAVANANDAPTGAPTISGTATEDQILTADTSGIADADGLGAFSYQWYRDTGGGPVAIGGATASTYTLGDADVGATITVGVSYVDGGGTAEGPLMSAPTAAIANINDTPTGGPVITGTAAEDQTLTADTSGISDADGISAFSYQWYRDTGGGPVAIGGATASTYTLGDADVGATITVEVSFVDDNGTAEGPFTSAAAGPVTNVNDAPTGAPAITGTVAEDQMLTADTSGIGDADGLGAFSYQWYRDTGGGPIAIGGATASTYMLGDADVGATMTVAVSYVDGNGTAEGPLVSAPTAPVANVNDAPTGTPAITGTAAEDQMLTADTSGISDPDGLGAFSYQWYRDTGGGPVAIGGATASTYTLGDADVGAAITVAVSYVDGNGTAEGPLVSAPTAAVTNVNDTPTGVPAITGTVTEDQTLTADTSGIADADGLGAFSYQWYRDTGSGPVAIGGATAPTYTLGDADVGATMAVAVTYVDGNGTAEGPLVSAPTAAVANINDAPVITSNGGLATANLNVDEGDQAVTTVASSDVDGGPPAYSITGGADGALFNIDGATGVLSFVAEPDFEAPADADADNIYHVRVQVDDGNGGQDFQDIFVTVIDDPSESGTTDPPPPPPDPTPDDDPDDDDDDDDDDGDGILTDPTTDPELDIGDGFGPDGTGSEGTGEKEDGAEAAAERKVPDVSKLQPDEQQSTIDPHWLLDEDKEAAGDGAVRVQIDIPAINAQLLSSDPGDMASEMENNATTLGFDPMEISLGGGVAITSGIVAWALRGSALASSLLAAAPTWHRFDPIIVLVSRDEENQIGAESGESMLERLFKTARQIGPMRD